MVKKERKRAFFVSEFSCSICLDVISFTMKEETEKEIKSERDASMNSSLNSTGSSTSNDNMWVGRARVEYQDMKRLRKIDMENSFHEKRNRNLERIKEQNAIRRRSDITGIHPGQIQRKRSFKMREDVKEAVFRDVLKANSNNFVCRLKPYILPPCVGLPFSLRWLPTNSNIAADDGKGLQHIPYINDQVIEKEMSFIEELIELNGNSNTNFKGNTRRLVTNTELCGIHNEYSLLFV